MTPKLWIKTLLALEEQRKNTADGNTGFGTTNWDWYKTISGFGDVNTVRFFTTQIDDFIHNNPFRFGNLVHGKSNAVQSSQNQFRYDFDISCYDIQGGGYKVQQVGVYKVQLVRVYKVSLFFGFGKWVFIRSSFFNFHMVSHFFKKSCICLFCENASL